MQTANMVKYLGETTRHVIYDDVDPTIQKRDYRILEKFSVLEHHNCVGTAPNATKMCVVGAGGCVNHSDIESLRHSAQRRPNGSHLGKFVPHVLLDLTALSNQQYVHPARDPTISTRQERLP